MENETSLVRYVYEGNVAYMRTVSGYIIEGLHPVVTHTPEVVLFAMYPSTWRPAMIAWEETGGHFDTLSSLLQRLDETTNSVFIILAIRKSDNSLYRWSPDTEEFHMGEALELGRYDSASLIAEIDGITLEGSLRCSSTTIAHTDAMSLTPAGSITRAGEGEARTVHYIEEGELRTLATSVKRMNDMTKH